MPKSSRQALTLFNTLLRVDAEMFKNLGVGESNALALSLPNTATL